MSTTPFDPDTTLIRLPEVIALTGLSRAAIYRRIKNDKTFPKAVPLSSSDTRQAPVGYVLGEVKAWVETQKKSRETAAA